MDGDQVPSDGYNDGRAHITVVTFLHKRVFRPKALVVTWHKPREQKVLEHMAHAHVCGRRNSRRSERLPLKWTFEPINFAAGRRGAVVEDDFYNKLEKLNVQAGKRDKFCWRMCNAYAKRMTQ